MREGEKKEEKIQLSAHLGVLSALSPVVKTSPQTSAMKRSITNALVFVLLGTDTNRLDGFECNFLIIYYLRCFPLEWPFTFFRARLCVFSFTISFNPFAHIVSLADLFPTTKALNIAEKHTLRTKPLDLLPSLETFKTQ